MQVVQIRVMKGIFGAPRRLALGGVALVYPDQWWRWFKVVFATVGYGPAGLKETGRSWGKGNELGGYGMELDLYAVWTQPELLFLLGIFNWLGYTGIKKQSRFYSEMKRIQWISVKDVLVRLLFGIFALNNRARLDFYSLSKSLIGITYNMPWGGWSITLSCWILWRYWKSKGSIKKIHPRTWNKCSLLPDRFSCLGAEFPQYQGLIPDNLLLSCGRPELTCQ